MKQLIKLKWPNYAEKCGIPCLSTNLRNIVKKFTEFQTIIIIDSYNPKIVGVTESWCDSKILDTEIWLSGYKLYRQDHIYSKGGRVLLYVHDCLPSIPFTILNNNNIHMCLDQLDDNTLIVGVVYRSPHSSADDNALLNTTIQNIHQIHRYTHLLLIGALIA